MHSLPQTGSLERGGEARSVAAVLTSLSFRMRVVVGVGLAASLVLLLVHSLAYWFLCDDAFISFRYARNLAHGSGLVFNPGLERVEGYSNFLWVLILAAAERLGLPPDRAANPLSLAATVGLWAVVSHFALRRAPHGGRAVLVLVPALALASMRTVAVWSTSGLEARLFELLAVGGGLRLVDESESLAAGRAARPVAGWLLALACLTRPDGLLVACATLGIVLLALSRIGRIDRGWLLRTVAPCVALIGAHVVFRLAYYGDLWPNTYYVKAEGRVAWDSGIAYLAAFVLEYALWLWLPLLVVGVVGLVSSKRVFLPLVAGAAIVPHAIYIARLGGDHFEYRPLGLYVPFLALLLFEGARYASEHFRGYVIAVWLGLIAMGNVALPLASHRQFPDRYSPGFPGLPTAGADRAGFLEPERNPVYRLPALEGLALGHRELLRFLTSQYVGVRQEEHRMFLDIARSEGRALRGLVERGFLPRDTYVAIDCVGAIPYESDLPVLDRLGLTDALVARSARSPERVMAHEKRASFEYARERGVDLWAFDGVRLLARASEEWPLVGALRGNPFWVADCGDGTWLAAMLPRGVEAASRRFPRLSFVSSLDPEFVHAYAIQGIALLEDELDREPNPVARFRLAYYRLVAGFPDEALPLLEACAREQPENPQVWHGLGVARLSLGDPVGAAADLDRALALAEAQGLGEIAAEVRSLAAEVRATSPR